MFQAFLSIKNWEKCGRDFVWFKTLKASRKNVVSQETDFSSECLNMSQVNFSEFYHSSSTATLNKTW